MTLRSRLLAAAAAALTTAALVLAVLVAPAAPAAPARPHAASRTTYGATLHATPTLVAAGSVVTLTGRVRPARRGTAVELWKRIRRNDAWRREAVLRTDRQGRFSYRDRPHSPGTRHYRVVVPPTAGIRAGRSTAVRVDVATWRSLTYYPMRASDSTTVDGGGATIGGAVYAPVVTSVDGAAQGMADWNIPATCSRVRFRVGAGDQGDEGYVATIGLRSLDRDGNDSMLYAPRSFALTESDARGFDVSNVFRLTFSWTSSAAGSNEPAAGAQALLARPQLLCLPG